jgi:hypothetical protein
MYYQTFIHILRVRRIIQNQSCQVTFILNPVLFFFQGVTARRIVQMVMTNLQAVQPGSALKANFNARTEIAPCQLQSVTDSTIVEMHLVSCETFRK